MKDIFGKDIQRLKEKKLYLLDMDGTVYLDEILYDGVLDFLKKIEQNGGRYVFITNNASKSVKDYVAKMHRLGLPFIGEEHFFTSVQASCKMLKEKQSQFANL